MANYSIHSAARHGDYGIANLQAVRDGPAPMWRDLHPKPEPADEAEAKRLTDGASYIASRGHEQLPELKRWIEAASGADWMRRVQVHGAVANNHGRVVQMLLDEVGVDADCRDKDGWCPLHYSAIWGRPGIAVLLLSRGADHTARSQLDDNTPFDISRIRLGKLKAQSLDNHDDIEHMREEAAELVRLFGGIEAAGGDYEKWATCGTEISNRHVQHYSPGLIAASQRHAVVALRALATAGRANVKTVEQLSAEEKARAAAAEAARKAAEGPPKTLEEAMEAAGLLAGESEKRRIMMRQMHKLLEVRTLADLAGVAREDVAELDELEAAERRTLWAFIQQHKPKDNEDGGAAAAADADGGKKKKGGAGGGGAKKKGGKKKADDELSALLAEGGSAKKSSGGGSKKKSGGGGSAKGVATSTAAAAAAAAAKASGGGGGGGGAGGGAGGGGGGADACYTSSMVPSNKSKQQQGGKKGGGGGGGAAAEDEDGEEGGAYKRHWPDEPSVLSFVFRDDLPTDAFNVVVKFLYSGPGGSATHTQSYGIVRDLR